VRESKQRLESWGRLSSGETLGLSPQTEPEAREFLNQPPAATLIPYGAGRSYGDQALNSAGAALITRNLKRMLSFDPATGELVCEAGVSLREVVERYLPQGFMPPVSPGTGFVTLGGCIANDVHGKNHEHMGSFGQHVAWFDLLLPSGEVRRVWPGAGPLFRATVGGMGLTGLILRLCINLMRVPSNAVVRREERIPNLEAFLERLEAVRREASYSVGWIDALASGTRLGRGILETSEPSATPLSARPATRFTMPRDLPAFVLNPLSIRAFNELYYHRIPVRGRELRVSFERFLYPLDALGQWNRLYGRRGFFQFQCVLPDGAAAQGLRRILKTVSERRAASFLAVLKTLGSEGPGMLSFPRRGYTLALDFPNRAGVRSLLSELEAITLDHEGRVYLAKDAALSPRGFRRMYPQWTAFRRVLDEIDPDVRMMSDMARRLGIRQGEVAEASEAEALLPRRA